MLNSESIQMLPMYYTLMEPLLFHILQILKVRFHYSFVEPNEKRGVDISYKYGILPDK